MSFLTLPSDVNNSTWTRSAVKPENFRIVCYHLGSRLNRKRLKPTQKPILVVEGRFESMF